MTVGIGNYPESCDGSTACGLPHYLLSRKVDADSQKCLFATLKLQAAQTDGLAAQQNDLAQRSATGDVPGWQPPTRDIRPCAGECVAMQQRDTNDEGQAVPQHFTCHVGEAGHIKYMAVAQPVESPS